MKILQSPIAFCYFCFQFFLSVAIAQSDYSLPNQYFINCGSTGNTRVNGRDFVGDQKPTTFSLSAGRSTALTTSTASDLYGSARVFKQPSSYDLDIAQNGTYVVRFHFSASISQDFDLYRAKFNVTASKYYLLSDFTVERNSSDSGLIREFLFNVTVGKLSITFSPSGGSIAFVNAIEAFLAPDNLIADNASRASDPTGSDQVNGLWSRALQVIHRINVGGDKVEPQFDGLLRTWDSDEPYMSVPDAAANRSGQPNFDDFAAPRLVYDTAKVLKNSSTNASWQFKVNQKSSFLVRAHFCDLISFSGAEDMIFDLHINSFTQQVDVVKETGATLAFPFYLEYELDSDDSAFMNISISRRQNSAFLNGLEIMQLINSSSSLTGIGVGNENGASKNHLSLIIGLVAGGVVLIIASVVLLWCFCCRAGRKAKPVQSLEDWQRLNINRRGSSKSSETIASGSQLPDLNLGLKMALGEVLFATKNFDEHLVIGEGGFGKVYRGILRDGTKVAVKRSEPGRTQGLSEFQTEIMVLSKIRHRHLVSLIGYCDERLEMVLVYEYMEKGTLRDHLYRSRDDSTQGSYSDSKLSWEKRLELCIDAAKGLHYLHTGLGGAVIHRDVKSTNILLDEHYVAKVADFGISRLGVPDQSHVSTEVKGSFGYMDPEYFRCLALTQKSDVYSFGVVLLEVLCARAALDNMLPKEQVNLADWGVSCITRGELDKVVDPQLAGKIAPDSLRRFGQIVQKCLKDYGADRPNMVDLLWDLEYALKLQQTAQPRQPQEDSYNSDISYLALPEFNRLPSQSFVEPDDDKDLDESYTQMNANNTSVSEVFSQIIVQEPR